MFIEQPIDYDQFLDAEPEKCAKLFFANAKAQISILNFLTFMKIFLSVFWGLFGGWAIPLVTGSYYDIFIDEQDYYFMCAMGQEGFSQELFDGDWWYQKAYLKQLARDLARNPTPLFYVRALAKLKEVFSVMGEFA